MLDTQKPAPRLTEEQVAEIRRRRPGVRASLAIEGLYLTADEERMLDQFEAERLTPEQRRERVRAYGRSLRPQQHAAK
jgi:hypothetical protein